MNLDDRVIEVSQKMCNEAVDIIVRETTGESSEFIFKLGVAFLARLTSRYIDAAIVSDRFDRKVQLANDINDSTIQLLTLMDKLRKEGEL